MRRVKDCLRLYHACKMSKSQIARSLNLARSTVWDYLDRARQHNLTIEQASSLSDEDLERLLFRSLSPETTRSLPDFAHLHTELCKAGVTLRLLWEEYRSEHPDGYGYSQFCGHYQQWSKHLKVYMRHHYIGGEKAFVDYSGKKPSIVDPKSGEQREVELFVMCWGASNYLYAEAHERQDSYHWIMGHIHAFEYFQCVPKILIPDNLKSAVTKAHYYDPDLNRAYTELSEHYGFAVIPARVKKWKDKGKVETGVQIVQRWILARLRHRVFHSIEQLNGAIRQLLADANNRKLQRLESTRQELFATLDRPNALELNATRYEYRVWYKPTIYPDYHIEIKKHYYSVPWNYYGKKVSACTHGAVLEVFYGDNRIAIHTVSERQYGYSTLPEHMPAKHRNYLHFNLYAIVKRARAIGPHTEKLINKLIVSKVHPQQGYRPAQGILRLAQTYSPERLEAASVIALEYGLKRVRELADLLKNGKDRQEEETMAAVKNTGHVRGARYYQQSEVAV